MADKIKPALSADRWASLSTPYAGDIVVDRIVANANEARQTALRPTKMAAIIALANAELLDSDKRKITREWVTRLRTWAELADNEVYNPLQLDPDEARAMADALESYLPPES